MYTKGSEKILNVCKCKSQIFSEDLAYAYRFYFTKYIWSLKSRMISSNLVPRGLTATSTSSQKQAPTASI